MTMDMVLAGIKEKRPNLRYAEKCFLAKNPFFSAERLIFL